MSKVAAKNNAGKKYLLKLSIAGVVSSVILPGKYSLDFIKTLKVRYRYFISKKPEAGVRLVYKGRPDKYSFENFLRLTYSSLLLRKEGFLLHSSGVICRGKGYIFTGVSGAGKTTAAEESKKYGLVLSDEILALRKIDGGWKLFGTPFMGLMLGGGRNRSIKKPRLLYLRQAKKNVLKRISMEKAWAKLLRNVVLYKPEKKITGLTFDFVSSVRKEILEFRKTGFWRVLWAAK